MARTWRPELLVSGEHFDQMSDELRDLELDFLKQSYRAAFKAASLPALQSPKTMDFEESRQACAAASSSPAHSSTATLEIG